MGKLRRAISTTHYASVLDFIDVSILVRVVEHGLAKFLGVAHVGGGGA